VGAAVGTAIPLPGMTIVGGIAGGLAGEWIYDRIRRKGDDK
jgi:hypothetical protein